MKKNKKHLIGAAEASPIGNIFINILFLALCVCCIYPILLIIGTSFADENYLSDFGYKIFPEQTSVYAYQYILKNAGIILRAYGVTIVSTLLGTGISVLVCGLYAYTISRREFYFKKFFTFYSFFTMLFNGGMVPWYLVCTRIIGIDDTIWALVLPSAVSAWNIMILKTFFATSVPEAIVESARIDGASEFRTFFRIVWPISLPGLATIGLFAMLAYWNDYYTPLMLTSNQKLQTLQLYLYNILSNISMLTNSASAAYQQAGQTVAQLPKESARMAMCVITIGPIIFAYPFFQRYFIQGLTVGAVKG